MFKGIDSGLRVLVSSMVLVTTVASCTVTKRPAIEIESVRDVTVAMTTNATNANLDRDESDAPSTTEHDSTATENERALPEADDDSPVTPPATQRVLRRVKNSELSAALVAKASQIIHEHHAEPFGTEIPFEIDGHEYVGRIERHYHPEGGELRPWGYHPGCSLFVVENAS